MITAELIRQDEINYGHFCEDWDEFFQGDGLRSLTIKRQQATDPDSAGGALINEPLVNAFHNALQETGVRRWARRNTTETAGDRNWPMSDDRSNAAVILNENAGFTETDITYANVQTTPWHYVTAILMSAQFDQDRFDTGEMGHLGEILGQRMRLGSDKHFLSGTGTGQPQGLFAGAVDAGNLAGATAVTKQELQDLEALVDPAYWEMPGSGWVMTPALLASAKSLGDQQYAFVNGQHYIRGHRAYASVNAAGIAFGNLRNYIIHDTSDFILTIIRDHPVALNNQLIIRATYRADGRCWIPAIANGVALVKSGTP